MSRLRIMRENEENEYRGGDNGIKCSGNRYQMGTNNNNRLQPLAQPIKLSPLISPTYNPASNNNALPYVGAVKYTTPKIKNGGEDEVCFDQSPIQAARNLNCIYIIYI